MTLKETIAVFEEFANNPYKFSEVNKQYAEWLKILKKAKFEYDEAQ